MPNKSSTIAYILLFVLSLFPKASLTAQTIGFQFKQDKKVVKIPFEYINGFIIVKAKLNGVKPIKFIFDTGAQHILLFDKLSTDNMGLEYVRKYPLVGSDMNDAFFAYLSLGLKVNIGRKIVNDFCNILVLEEDYFKLSEYLGFPVDGILGAGVLKKFVFKVDYRKKVLSFYPDKHFKTPSKKFEAFPLEVKRGKPYLQATITMPNDSVVNTKLLLDTGAAISLLLHSNSHKDLQIPKKFIKGKLAMGLGGFLRGYQARISKIQFSKYSFSNLITNFQDYNTALDTNFLNQRNGILGNDLLHRFTTIYDYPNQKIYFKARRNYQKAIKYDKSGLILIATGNNLNRYIVKDVIPLSPASRAGILPNDVISKLGWIPASWYTLKGLTRKFQRKEGKKIKLVILRAGKKLKFSFKLRSLL